ncbi:hypothetical protein BT63DRAFT_66369 [Microthyrium microscopicum]|uniref:Zn(2)-C6 fungal-type domain-containing protein n=1 Tax=Microthyrium microscopicum TaxID=703497 RepID=A0A6A6TZD2_9PEZI|nr:hypothetical protein BT63DRAFT_66369 [Microthyrium microscopicum]
MPIPRRSCKACFMGKRKCDLGRPHCGRCLRNSQSCDYPSSPEDDTCEFSNNGSDDFLVAQHYLQGFGDNNTALQFTLDKISPLSDEILYPALPNMVGNLGELQPVSGITQSYQWVVEQLKSYPAAFAQTAATVFIHSTSYCSEVPRDIRAAFGICAASVSMDEKTESMIYRAIDAEASDLLRSRSDTTLKEDLANIQAMVLYQSIRLFQGDLKQRVLVQQQEVQLESKALKLLQRAKLELEFVQPSWERWILTESIRRVVAVLYMLYAMNSVFEENICRNLPTLTFLPVSSNSSFWQSEANYLQNHDGEETVKYGDFSEIWLVSPHRKLDPFEKLLLVACKGIEPVEALSSLAFVESQTA